jgi:7,8-dihydro-6-hydroxymethylpterin-pyrophosphokinase
MSDRPFVLVPLADLLPHWRHPVSGLTADQLLRRQGGIQRLMLRREISRVDSESHPCD